MDPLIRILIDMHTDKKIICRTSSEIDSVADVAHDVSVMVRAQVLDTRSANARQAHTAAKARHLDIPHSGTMRAFIKKEPGFRPAATDPEALAVQDHTGRQTQPVAGARPQRALHLVVFDDPISATAGLPPAAICALREAYAEAQSRHGKRSERQRPRRRHEDRPVGVRSYGRRRRPVARVISRN